MPDDQRVRAARAPVYRFGQPRFLRAGHQMVDQHAQPSLRARPELLDDADEIVDAAEVFDHHALDPQIIAPHLLDKLGVVAAFDVDPAGPGYPRPAPATATEPDAVRVAALGDWAARRGQDDRFAVDEISRADRERFGSPRRSSSSIRPYSTRTTAPT